MILICLSSSFCLTHFIAVGVLETHPSVCSAISCAAATAAANLLRQPLFLHLANTFRAAPPGTFSMPLPFASVVAGGGGGKLRVKEFLVGSLPSCPLEEQLTSIASVHRELGRILSAKQGVRSRVQVLLNRDAIFLAWLCHSE